MICIVQIGGAAIDSATLKLVSYFDHVRVYIPKQFALK